MATEASLAELVERLIVLLERFASQQRRSGLRCIECGEPDEGERGWKLRSDVDGELVAFCPDCDRELYGDV